VAVGHLYNDTFMSLRLGPNVFLGVDELDRLDGVVGDHTAASSRKAHQSLERRADLEVLSRVTGARRSARGGQYHRYA